MKNYVEKRSADYLTNFPISGEAFRNIDFTVTALVAPKLAKLMSKGEEIMTKNHSKLDGKERRKKAPEAPNRVTMAVIPKDITKTRNNLRVKRPNSRKGILKLPVINVNGTSKENIDEKCIDKITKENTIQNVVLPLFGRAGVEKIWEHNAKQFYANQAD